MGIIHTKVVDYMYLIASLSGLASGASLLASFPLMQKYPSIIEIAFAYHKNEVIVLSLCWVTIMAAKFSFLFFFKQLIDRIWGLSVYWWCVTIYNVAVLGYGVAVYYLSCPYFNDLKACK